MTSVALTARDSAASVSPAPARIDPYWSGMWNVSSTAAWSSRPLVERRVAQGLTRAPRWLSSSVDEHLDSIAFGRRSAVRQSALAATNLFRTLTVEQLAAVTGGAGAADVASLYGSGLVQQGVVVTHDPRSRFCDLVRPSNTADLSGLRPRLSWSKLVALGSGHEWSTRTSADRHNVLATELLLRVAEYRSDAVPLVLGEGLCEMRLLAPPGVSVPVTSSRAGDGLIVRSDGLRVVVEVTAGTSNVEEKVSRWADMLAQDAGRTMAVLFVEVPHPDRPDLVAAPLRRAMARAVRGMDAVLGGVAERMMVARWPDWFPDVHLAGPGFFSLSAERPTGGAGERWQPVDVLDPFDLEFTPGPGVAVLAENASVLTGIPRWMRSTPAFSVAELV